MDRIDLYVAMDEISKDDKTSISSKEMSEKKFYKLLFLVKNGGKKNLMGN